MSEVAYQEPASGAGAVLASYLEDSRALVVDEIRRLMPRDGAHTGGLYALMLDYPLRAAKGLRPALCMASCRALGGHLEAVLPTAAALELYHNAFLLHDDVEDGSEKRRNEATLNRQHGAAIAINVGDGMLALTMQPLLDNAGLIGLGRTLRILHTVARMARESAEGQGVELRWIRDGEYTPSDRAYLRMVLKKTAWYSFVAPVAIGATAAGAAGDDVTRLTRFATVLGIAFQIQDDVLNLVAEEARYGKEIAGDLWEGKHTLILIHALRCASAADRERALAILRKPRPAAPPSGDPPRASQSLGKTVADVAFLRALIDRAASVAHAWESARALSQRAERAFARLAVRLPRSVHRDFLAELVGYVVQRDR
jgi:geranylgeranyl diphosphate synthase type II